MSLEDRDYMRERNLFRLREEEKQRNLEDLQKRLEKALPNRRTRMYTEPRTRKSIYLFGMALIAAFVLYWTYDYWRKTQVRPIAIQPATQTQPLNARVPPPPTIRTTVDEAKEKYWRGFFSPTPECRQVSTPTVLSLRNASRYTCHYGGDTGG